MYLDKPIPLRGAGRRRRRGPARGRRSGGLIVVLGLVLVNYLLFFQGEDTYEGPSTEERLAATSAERAEPRGVIVGEDGQQELIGQELDDFGDPVGRKIAGSLRRGQTVLKALRTEGIDSQSAMPLIHAMRKIFDFRKAQVGDTFDALVNDEGQVTRFSYTQSPLEIFDVVLMADNGTYEATKREIRTAVEVAYVGCAIKSSLYESLARCGEGAGLASKVIDLFAWDVDFFQDIREGDVLKVIVEKESVEDRFLRYGEVVAAEYHGKFGKHRIVRYEDPNKVVGHYKTDGRSIQKDFLKSPLKYTRMSARGGVMHSKSAPVTYTAAAHTAVWAVSAGTVVFAGTHKSLGKTVIIRHEHGYTSTYARLGSIARGIREGEHVGQKRSIGKLGSGNEAQLQFILRKGGRAVDPRKVRFTEGDPVAPEFRADFDTRVEGWVGDLDGTPVVSINERRS